MASVECIAPIKVGMKLRRDMIGVACEALNRMFGKDIDDGLVEQVQIPGHRAAPKNAYAFKLHFHKFSIVWGTF